MFGFLCGSDLITDLTKQNHKCLLNASIEHILCQEVVSKNVFASLPQKSYIMNVVLECTEDMCKWLMVEADVLICEKLENWPGSGPAALDDVTELFSGRKYRFTLSTVDAQCLWYPHKPSLDPDLTHTYAFSNTNAYRRIIEDAPYIGLRNLSKSVLSVSPFYSMTIPVLLT